MSVVIAADPGAQGELSEVLTELLTRIGADPQLARRDRIDPLSVVTPPISREHALARVFIDATDPSVALLYLVDADWERILVRRVPLKNGLDEVAREQLAHIVESSVEALRAGGTIGVSRERASSELGLAKPPETRQTVPVVVRARPAPSPDLRDAPAIGRKARARLSLGLGWSAALWTSDQLMHGPLARLEVELAGEPIWGVAITGQYRFPLIRDDDPVDLRLESGALRLLGTAKLPIDPGFRIALEAGGGLDLERIVSQGDQSPGLDVSDTELRLAPMGRLGAGPAFQLFGQSWLTTLVGLDVDLAPADYVVRRGSETHTVAEPLVFRPSLSLVLGAPVSGL